MKPITENKSNTIEVDKSKKVSNFPRLKVY